MPTISRPPPGDAPPLPRRPRPRQAAPSLSLRSYVATHGRSLTRELSEGMSPASSPALTLRAAQLTTDRRRRMLPRSPRPTVHEPPPPPPRRAVFGLARRSAVMDAQDAIDILVKRLRSPEPVAAEGVALIERMLSDGAWGPLYNAGPVGAVRRLGVV